jgi:2'-5' RNA ligase
VVRAFVAIKIDPGVAERISEFQSKLDKTLGGIRWVGPESQHLTLKFLGEVEDDKVAPIAESLERALHSMPRFSVSCRGLGVFPDIRRAKVLWVALEGKPIATLAAMVEDALAPLGFAREKREFKPHLTIGRWRESAGRPEVLRRELESGQKQDFGSSWISEVILFQSVLRPTGAVHTPLKVFPLAQSRTEEGGS